MKFELTILGSSSATPVYNRNQSAQLLNCNDNFYLIDCGESTQQQLIKYNLKAARIDHIFISHLHGDHFFGLIGLLSSMHLSGRKKTIHIYCPEPLKEILDIQFKYSETLLNFPIQYHFTHTDKPEVILKNQDIEVETIILNHRIPCTGFKFSQVKRLRKLIIEKLEADKIGKEYYHLIKRNEEVTLLDGRIIKNEDYTIDSPRPRSYAYCSDTMFDTKYFNSIKHCDTLYHECTFLHELLERALSTHHTTALQAGEVAKINEVGKLIIGHFSSRYKILQPLLDEAKSVFENTELAKEGAIYQL